MFRKLFCLLHRWDPHDWHCLHRKYNGENETSTTNCDQPIKVMWAKRREHGSHAKWVRFLRIYNPKTLTAYIFFYFAAYFNRTIYSYRYSSRRKRSIERVQRGNNCTRHVCKRIPIEFTKSQWNGKMCTRQMETTETVLHLDPVLGSIHWAW